MFQFADGASITVNKGMLCYNVQSDAFYQMLFGPLKREIIEILDIESSAFKLFLDCVMGFEPYTHDNCLIIFPVVWKYQIENLIEKCKQFLLPTDIQNVNEKTCEALNMAVKYDYVNLYSGIIHFIFKDYGLFKFLENKEYCLTIEPDSMFKILKKMPMYLDSFSVNVLMEWGKNYLEEHDEFENIYELFEKYKLTQFINYRCFETTSGFIDFSLSEFGKYFFKTDEIFSILRFSTNLEYLKSKWIAVNKNEVVIEDITLEKFIAHQSTTRSYFYSIGTNLAVFYDAYHNQSDQKLRVVSVEITTGGNTGRLNGLYKSSSFWPSFSKKFHVSNAFAITHDNHFSTTTFTVKIKYIFNYDCRILLTNKLQDSANGYNMDKMLFTNEVKCCGVL